MPTNKQLGDIFQSALPRGERRSFPQSIKVRFDFNPRSREGSDSYSSSILCASCDFNPRSREGSDIYSFIIFSADKLFQSALPRGERLQPMHGSFSFFYFNPRSREGSDSFFNATDHVIYISIRAPARGATKHRNRV